MQNIQNAKEYPRIFYCRHMLPGIVSYASEHILIDADAMKRAAPSFVGKPVYVNHQKVDLTTLEQDADGYVVDCFYNELDGWLWARFILTSDEGQRAAAQKWSVSNAYNPLTWSERGQHLGVDYDRKMQDYSFTHLAIVPNPRYDDAKIFTPEEFKAHQLQKRTELEELQNSNDIKPKQGHPMFKFFQKKSEELTNAIPADADLSQIEVELEGGKRMSLQEIVNAVKKNDDDEKAKEEAEKEKQNKKSVMNDDTEVTVGEEKMTMGELMNKWNAVCKKNSDDDAAAKAEEEEKKNAEAEEKKKKDAEEKENAKRFDELQNASTKKAMHVEVSQDKVKRGQQRYGSKK